MFICCSATTLGIVVRYDTAIRPRSDRCLLADIRLCPFVVLASNKGWSRRVNQALGPWSGCRVPIAIGLIPVRCLFVVSCWEGCITPVLGSSPIYRVYAAIDLSPDYSTPTTDRISVGHFPTAIGLASARCGMSIHLSWATLLPTSTDVGLLSGGPPWCSACRLHLRGYEGGFTFSPFFKLIIVLTLDVDPNGILLGVGSIPLAAGQSVSQIFFERFRLWTGSGTPIYCRIFTIFSWKLGILVMSNSAFQSWNHSVGPSF